MFAKLIIRLALPAWLVFLGVVTAFAQTAQIQGTITDATGASVPLVEVTATNADTGAKRPAKSNEEGYYSLPLLPPGNYSVSVAKEGFKAVARTGVTVKVDETARIDFVIELGQLSQTVNVVGESPMVTTDTGTVKQVIDQRRIVDLPLNGRNAGELVFLAAGTVRDTRTRGTYVYGSSIAPDTQTPAVNGARSNGVAFRMDGANNNDNYTGVANPFPNPDALQEFSVQTNSFSAEFGNAPGGVVNIRTKSGTNTLHGTAFEFLRNGAVNARNFFAAKGDNLKRNQFGGTLGGPVVRDKIFFFGSYEGTRVRSTNGGQSQFVLTDAMRRGDFSAFSGRLIDPQTSTDFPGKIIPAGRMDPVALKLLDYMPHTSDPTGRVFYSLPSQTNYNEYMVKSDQLHGRSQFYERFFQYDLNSPAIFPDKNILTQFTDGRGIRVQTLAVNHIYTFSPGLLNNATFTWEHNRGGTTPAAPFGLPDLGARLAQPQVPALGVAITGYAGYSTSQLARITRDNYEFSDSLNWIHGKHQVIMGGSLLRMHQNIVNDFRKNGSFSFTNDFTGNSAANFLLGQVTTFTQGGGEYKALRGWRVNAFVQDNYRVSRSLTLNLGVRIDPWIPYTDELHRITCVVAGTHSQRYPLAPAGLLFAGDPGCYEGGTPGTTANFAPRLGFAYAPGTKWSIRGGYGIFWEQPETVLYNRFVDNAPFAPTFLLSGVPLSDPYRGTVNPFPAKYGPRNPGPDETFERPVLSTTFDFGFRPQYMQNWNLSMERELGGSTVVRAGYVAAKGTHLRTNIESNAALYSASATVGNTQQRRIYPDFSSIVKTLSAGNSSYQSLQLTAEKRMTRALSFVANYTYSKAIDYSSSNTTQGGSDIPNPFNIRSNRGQSDYDVPHRLILSSVFALPQLAHSGALVKHAFGGWQVSGIWNWQSGFPFSILSGADNARSGVGQDRADYIGGGTQLSGDRSKQDQLNRWFNTSAFAQNQLGTFGNGGRNILRGPHNFNVDFSAQKYFKLTERIRTQFRAEFFNLTNTPSFSLPGNNFASPSFGKITGAGDPRILQFGLKILF